MENKPLSLKLANGREEYFENGSQMYDFWIRQANANKRVRKNTKQVADAIIEEVTGEDAQLSKSPRGVN
jgi:hypothetical protein